MTAPVRATTNAIYCGVKTGLKKTNPSEQWAALTFKTDSAFEKMSVPADQLSRDNLTIFPEDNFDFSQFVSGKKYQLILSLSSSKYGMEAKLLSHKEIQ